jgi:transposase-like protein
MEHQDKRFMGCDYNIDEVFLTINGERHDLWRAVDQDGHVLDILVQSRRNKKAAKKFFRKLLKGLMYVPRVIVTDKLKSDGAAKQEMLPGVEHRQHRYLNNRAENSHQPTRQRERRMQGFQVPRARPAFPLRLWSHHAALPAPPSPLACVCLAPRDAATISHLAGTYGLTDRSIRAAISAIMHPYARKLC